MPRELQEYTAAVGMVMHGSLQYIYMALSFRDINIKVYL